MAAMLPVLREDAPFEVRDHRGHDDHGHGEHAEGEDHNHECEEHAEVEAHGHDFVKNHAEPEEAAHGDHGNAHGAHDSRAWLSALNASMWLILIAAIEKIEALSAEISATLNPVRGGRFIVFHDGYQYFDTEFDLRRIVPR